MVNVAVLVSGGGTNLEAILKAKKEGKIPSGNITLVVSDTIGSYALERARNHGIEAVLLNKKALGRKEMERELSLILHDHAISLIVLAGFLTILDPPFIKEWRNRIINIHPSLLPAFCGKGYYGIKVHQAVIASGVNVTGATVHLVNEIPDGGRILIQKSVPVERGDTPEILQKRVMEQAEWIILSEAVEMMCRRTEDIRSLRDYLKGNSYPGRFLLSGTLDDGKPVIAYAIMGRSENSRNRIFAKRDGMLVTVPYDASKVRDPSLIIYHAMRQVGGTIILTNGDQTDTIADSLSKGGTVMDALKRRSYEPDAPAFTSRISLVLTSDGASSLSIIRKNGDDCERTEWNYGKEYGTCHVIHTYEGDGDPLPTFKGEPRKFALPFSAEELADLLWDSLDEENKIAIFVKSGETEIIRNKKEGA
jgi:phosphoribosylglycinamide formyltransferase-1